MRQARRRSQQQRGLTLQRATRVGLALALARQEAALLLTPDQPLCRLADQVLP